MRPKKDIAKDQMDMAPFRRGGVAPTAMMDRAMARRPVAPRMQDYPARMSMPPSRIPMAAGGSVSSASSRADGCAQKGKTKGRII